MSAALKKGGNLPNDNHVARLIRFQSLVREDDKVVGIFPHAFKMREGEDYLSVSWVEYFGVYDHKSRAATANALQ